VDVGAHSVTNEKGVDNDGSLVLLEPGIGYEYDASGPEFGAIQSSVL